ncbi:hypothetical protein PAHAL_9G606200 [Panicum hallii]|uniref:Uncharacterized protein n=1 Tax=Panicum hallii TaxID=206008 RepID=A0A2T8I6E8_9POAL|nr:hypothetical protein PAHAL_9G606200 [Panicum hallii]
MFQCRFKRTTTESLMLSSDIAAISRCRATPAISASARNSLTIPAKRSCSLTILLPAVCVPPLAIADHGAARDPTSTLLLLFSFFLAATGDAADSDADGSGTSARPASSRSSAAAAPLTTPRRRRPRTRAPTFSPRSPPWPRPECSGALSRGGASVWGVCFGEDTALARR